MQTVETHPDILLFSLLSNEYKSIKAIEDLEKVQRRATEVLHNLRDLTELP